MGSIDGTTGQFHTTDFGELVGAARDRVLTHLGTRIMRPTYGTILADLAYENPTGRVLSRIQIEIAKALRAEPKIGVNSIALGFNEDDELEVRVNGDLLIVLDIG